MATDGTGIKVIVPKLPAAHNGYLELYRNDDVAVFQYVSDKSGDVVAAKLKPFHGTLTADATRAGAADPKGREALLKYVLRPPVATERVVAPEGLVRIILKKPFSDGTVAVDMDPLSLLCRLAATVPPPRFRTVRYAGVLSAHAKWRPLVSLT